MAIKGLTHQPPQFPQIGQLRKGKKDEQGRPVDLDYFRFTSDLAEVEQAFMEAYGEQPQLINVRLPHRTTDENWEAWFEEYVASGLVHRCDGEFIYLYRDKQSGTYVTPHPTSMRCPYGSGEKERTQAQGCHPSGRLQVIIPELGRLAYVMVITTSYNDIKNLDAQLRALEAIRGDLRGIPLQLRRRPDRISTPKMQKKGDNYIRTGDRVRRQTWLLSLEAAPDWVGLQLEAERLQALPEVPKQLLAPIYEIPPESWEYIEDEPPPEIEETEIIEVQPEPDEEAMPLGQALGTALLSAAPGYALVQGDPLLLAVRKDAKDLMEYLSKPSNYKALTNLTEQVQKAASILLENWDEAREIAMRNVPEKEDEIVEMEVEEGETVPLF